MRRRKTGQHAQAIAAFLMSVILLVIGCRPAPPPPEEDRLALEQVQRSVDNRLALQLEDELYVSAKLLPGGRMTEAELEQVYRDFFFLPDGRRRATDYVYLNVYDAAGRFLYQLAYDPRAGRMIRSRTEHH